MRGNALRNSYSWQLGTVVKTAAAVALVVITDIRQKTGSMEF